MAFDCTFDMKGSVAHLVVSGELDAASAQLFRARIEEAAKAQCTRLVLFMSELEYMASAGLRVLVFAKQKMSTDVDMYMVGVREEVLDTITMTGVDKSVVIVDKYEDD